MELEKNIRRINVIDLAEVVIEPRDIGHFYRVATWQGHTIGKAECLFQGKRAKLADILVEDEFIPDWPKGMGWLSWFRNRRPIELRGCGVGTMLLQAVVTEVKQAGFSELWGGVTRCDLERSPTLLEWYKRIGFEIQEPDAEALKAGKDVVRKITLTFR